MLYDPKSHTLTLGQKDCYCGDGTQLAPQPCATCKGSGRGKRGGARGCKPCHGSGNAYDPAFTETCKRCGGTIAVDENRCDTAPDDTLAGVDLQFVRVDRDPTWDERYLGIGSLVSVTDYGRAWESTRYSFDDLADEVRERHLHGVQAIKIAAFASQAGPGDWARVADTIAVVVTRGGYYLIAILDGELVR